MPYSMLHTWRLVEKRTHLYAQSFLPSDLLRRTCGLLQSSQRPTDVLMTHMVGLGQRHCATCVLTGLLLIISLRGTALHLQPGHLIHPFPAARLCFSILSLPRSVHPAAF